MSFFSRNKSVNKAATPGGIQSASNTALNAGQDNNDCQVVDALKDVIHLGKINNVVSEEPVVDEAGGSSKVSPVEAVLPLTVKLLEEMPKPILSNIINMLAPHLSIVRNLNRVFRSTVDEYVEKKAQRFRNATEEAECWETRPPQLNEHLQLDPLVLSRILTVMYEPKLLPHLPQKSAVSDNSDEETNISGRTSSVPATTTAATSNTVVASNSTTSHHHLTVLHNQIGSSNYSSIAAASTKTQKLLFKALKSAIDEYETMWWSISPLKDFIRRFQLHFLDAHSVVPTISSSSPTSFSAANNKQENMVGLDSSIASSSPESSIYQEKPLLSSSATSDDVSSKSNMNLLVYHVRRVKDISWLRMNCEIYRLAATYGHVALLPAVNEMERESVAGVLCASAEAAIKNRHHIVLVNILESAHVVAGCFWRVIDHSLDVAGFYYSSRTFKMDLVLAEGKRRGMIPKSTTSTATTDLDMQIAKLDTLLVLLDAVYNDGAGPVAYLMSNTAPMMLDLVNSPISATQIPTTSSGSPTGTNSSGIGSSSSSGGVSVHHQQHQIESCAREMAEKAEEIIKSNGIQWHLSRASGRFEIINGHQVFEEVKQKITELVVI